MGRSSEVPRSGRLAAADQRRALRRLLRELPEPVPAPALLPRTLAEVRRLQALSWIIPSRRHHPASPFQGRVAGESSVDVPVDVSEESDDVAKRRLA